MARKCYQTRSYQKRLTEYKQDTLTSLWRILNRVKSFGYTSSPQVLHRVGVRIEPLSLLDDSDHSHLYFQPLRADLLQSCPINVYDPMTHEKLETTDKAPYNSRQPPHVDAFGRIDTTPVHIAQRVASHFDMAPRTGLDPRSCSTLQKHSCWIPSTSDNPDVFGLASDVMPYCYRGTWCVRQSWLAQGYPHTMLLLAHAAGYENALLFGELTSIILAMITRLSLPSLEQHTVIPVMAISVIHNEVRILQAHWDGDEVVIRISPLCKPDTDDLAPYHLLTRYLASVPIGDTMSIPRIFKNPRGTITRQNH